MQTCWVHTLSHHLGHSWDGIVCQCPWRERCISYSIAGQFPGRQTESPAWCTDHQCVAWRQPATWATQGNSWEWRQRHGGLGLGGKRMTLPELLEDHQSHVFVADKKATKDFQDKLAMNQLTGFQLVFSLWTKVSGGTPNDSEWLWNLPCYLHFLL